MDLDRRTLLTAFAAAIALPKAAIAAPFVLRAEPVTAQILPEGEGTTNLLGFNGSSPGPELRYRKGDRVNLRFENAIGEGSSVHWHGIRIENAMDGVPGMTQPLVESGDDFNYSFKLPDAGTYWYHSHNRSWEQVARGLYGALVVEEEIPPDVDHDITVMLDDWRIERTGEMVENFGNRHDFSHAGRLGTFAKVMSSVTQVRRGDRVRLRLINVATARIFPLEISGLNGKVVALDGMPLLKVQDLAPMMLAPAQRIDIIADVLETVKFIFPTRQDPYELGEIVANGDNSTPRYSAIAPLPAAFVHNPDVSTKRALTLTLQGGAMGGQHVGHDLWSLNGVSGLHDTPWQSFSRGETARIKLINETAFPHGIHLHGHHFHEVDADGALGPLRDTTLVQRQESREIICVFDNPGKWLLHCHMLGHQASGMKTWIQVA